MSNDTKSDPSVSCCIVFTGGGTGGHIYPGLAVIESLRRMAFQGRIVWIGSEKEMDRQIVESAGVEFRAIPSGKFRREFSFRNLTDLGRIAAGYLRARSILAELNPAILFSKGGYVSVPPCRAAAGLGIPVFTHESDASPGLATRLNARYAERILTSWEDTASFFPFSLRTKVIRTGNPVRPSLFEGSRQRGIEHFGLDPNLPIVLVIGGSQGALELNRLVREALPLLCPRVQIVHQTGTAHYEEALAAIPADPQIRAAYRPLGYIGPEIADLYAAADLVAGRAGAGTVWEAASLEKPMVLVPLAGSGTRGDQVENAKLAEKAGAARVLMGQDVNARTFAEIVLSFLEPERRQTAVEACRALTRLAEGMPAPDKKTLSSSDYIARLVLERIGWRAKDVP